MLAVDFEKQLGGFCLQPRFQAGAGLVVLLGPSGSGKSLTLRAIAGLLRPDRGRIELPSGLAFDSQAGIDLPPQARNLGFVVQDLALFPHLSVWDNLAFALHGWRPAQRSQRVEELVGLLGLQGLEQRRPAQLSGGQQQRVALGRALAAHPGLLLLDEPFSGLDTPLREGLRREVLRLRRQLDLLVVFVTHDLQEAYALADSIAVYDQGEVLQYGPREQVFRQPASARVAHLLETRNVFEGRVVAVGTHLVEVETLWFHGQGRPSAALSVGQPVALAVRPEQVVLLPLEASPPSPATVLQAELVDETATGSSHRLYLRLVNESGPVDCLVEADVSAQAYQSLGVAERRRWQLALIPAQMAAVPV